MNDTDPKLQAWSQLLGAHALLLRRVEEHLKQCKMPPLAWYDVLWELERAGGALRIGELAERLVIERYNMTRLLDRLEKAGLLIRRPDTADRRGFIAEITLEGKDQRARMWPHYRKAVEAAFGDTLPSEDARQLTDILRRIGARLR